MQAGQPIFTARAHFVGTDDPIPRHLLATVVSGVRDRVDLTPPAPRSRIHGRRVRRAGPIARAGGQDRKDTAALRGVPALSGYRLAKKQGSLSWRVQRLPGCNRSFARASRVISAATTWLT